MFYVKSSDKTRIAVYDLNKKAKKIIILLHGWPLSAKMFEYQLPALLNAGYRIIRIDLRGFGNSDETTDGYNYEQFATDLYYVIKALDLKKFILAGFSMGGGVVVKYMSKYKGYGVNKLLLIDAAVPSYSKDSTNPYGQSIEDTNKLIELGYRDRPALNQHFATLFFHKKHSAPFLNWFQNLSDSASATGAMKSLILLKEENVFNDLKSIHVPTAIIHGKQDKICPFPMAELVHKNIATSTLIPIENAGHGSFYDRLEQFNQQMIAFLENKSISTSLRSNNNNNDYYQDGQIDI